MMTSARLKVLELLAVRGESYGLDLVKASDGALGRGSVYVVLDELESEGLIASREEDGDPAPEIGIKRRLYRITEFGRRSGLPAAGLVMA